MGHHLVEIKVSTRLSVNKCENASEAALDKPSDLQKLKNESNMLKYNIEVINKFSALDVSDTPEAVTDVENPEIEKSLETYNIYPEERRWELVRILRKGYVF